MCKKAAPFGDGLIAGIIKLVGKEMDRVSRTYDLSNLRLCFRILHNGSMSSDCRNTIIKVICL